MIVLFDVFKCLIRGINALKLVLIWSSLFLVLNLTTVYIKQTHQAHRLWGYNKNNNFDNRRISRTCVLGAQKNCLIEILLLKARNTILRLRENNQNLGSDAQNDTLMWDGSF